MRTKNATPYLFGAIPSSLRPPQPLMTLVVKATFRLAPGAPVRTLGGIGAQGTLSGDVFAGGAEDRSGPLAYATDFADFKPRADILVRAHCHTPGGRPMTECPVRVTVGAWSKTLRVVGPRTWKRGLLGDAPADPAPFTEMPVDFAHAFGGPALPDNPSGRGVGTPDLHNVELPGELVHSRDDRIRPVCFGPVSPEWPERRAKVGKEYGASWAARRAPYPAEDFDVAYFQAAPPDQQVDWLRGDEEISFQNLSPASPVFVTRLPGVRIRAFVNDVEDRLREVTMRLDTLFADLVDGKLVLTWRGIDEVREDDLADVKTVLVARERLRRAPRPAEIYEDALLEFEADPIGLGDALSRVPTEASGERSDDLEKVLAPLLDRLSPAQQNMVHSAVRRFESQRPGGVDVRAAIAAALASQTAEGPRVFAPTQPGAAPNVRLSDVLAKIRRSVDRLSGSAASAGHPLPSLEKLREIERDPMFARLGAATGDEGKDEPGPGADLSGRDLSGLDLSGRDLTGANLERAVLQKTKLTGATLARAKLGRAVLAEADLAGADLSEADLTQAYFGKANAAGAKLGKAVIDQAVFEKAALAGADLSGVKGRFAVFGGADLTSAKLDGAALEQALFDEATLAKATFDGASLLRCRLQKCDAKEASFRGATLDHAGFSESDLTGASLRDVKGEQVAFLKAILVDADLENAGLPGAHFLEAKADRAKLGGADLPRARFYRASLRSANLEGANLLYADLRKADLQGAVARRANLYAAELHQSSRRGLDLAGANVLHVQVEGGG